MKVWHFLLLTFMAVVGLPMKSLDIPPSYQIWNNAPHNAFTSLIEYNAHLYCAFREGKTHVDKTGGDNGKIRILHSVDGLVWESVDVISKKGWDLRDPFLSIRPDGRLTLSCGGAEYHIGKMTSYHTYLSTFHREIIIDFLGRRIKVHFAH